MAVSDTSSKTKEHLQAVNQAFKERDIQARARKAGLPYVYLVNVPLNPDLAKLLPQEDAEKALAVPFFHSGKRLKVAVADPARAETVAVLEGLGRRFLIETHLASEESVQSGMRIYALAVRGGAPEPEAVSEVHEIGADETAAFSEEARKRVEGSAADVSLDFLQAAAFRAGASDMHFQPEEGSVLLRVRIDGVLRPVLTFSREAYVGLLRQIKYLAHLKLNVTAVPQDGQYRFFFQAKPVNVRVSMMPSHYGETCVLRLLDPAKAFMKFGDLGFEGEALKQMERAVRLPHGMILVTGPTGSGKSTTMYAMLQEVDIREKKVITLEDPIEYPLSGITQSQVNPEAEYNFMNGLRAILRQDPDVIMVGEIRDLETAETAAQAALTGHLVFSTLHTNSTVESISRLTNMGVKTFILAPAIDLIIAQRLVRKLCTQCRKPRAPTDAEREHITQVLESVRAKGAPDVPENPAQIFEAAGCEACGKSGYKGQIALVEALAFDSGLRDLVLESKPLSEIYAYVSEKMRLVLLHEDGILKVARGVTSLEEAYRVAA